MEKEAIYSSLIQLLIHLENTSWNRFYSLLMAKSILILALATLFSRDYIETV